MERLRDYYGSPEYEQKIIRAIKAGNSPMGYSAKDILEDVSDTDLRGPKKRPLKGGMTGMAPKDYTMRSRY